MSGQMNTLGCYTLLVPVRVQVEEVDTFSELCRKVKSASGEASLHKRDGFNRILSVLRDEDLTGESLSEYVFNFYRFSFCADFPYSVRFSVAGEMSNHLTFNIFRNEKAGLDLQPDYRESVYTEEKAGYFCDAILAIAAQGTAGNAKEPLELADTAVQGVKKLSGIKAMGETEYRKITSMKGKTFPVERDLTIPSLFRRAAKQYKDARLCMRENMPLHSGSLKRSVTGLPVGSGVLG